MNSLLIRIPRSRNRKNEVLPVFSQAISGIKGVIIGFLFSLIVIVLGDILCSAELGSIVFIITLTVCICTIEIFGTAIRKWRRQFQLPVVGAAVSAFIASLIPLEGLGISVDVRIAIGSAVGGLIGGIKNIVK